MGSLTHLQAVNFGVTLQLLGNLGVEAHESTAKRWSVYFHDVSFPAEIFFGGVSIVYKH